MPRAADDRPAGLKERLRALYFGEDLRARRFRYALVAFDLGLILLFVTLSVAQVAERFLALDLVVAALLVLDLGIRLYIDEKPGRQLLNPWTAVDLVVIASLIAPVLTDNLAFLRVLRTLRVLRSYHLLREIRSLSPGFRLYEDVIQRTVNFFVFLFIVTSVVYVTQRGANPGVANYVDALYFTVTTLTTTGFGDITLQGTTGRLLSVVIMIVGVSLFLQLLRAIFRPSKVRVECTDCGLLLHDIDAIHCKHCGRTMHIPYEGAV